jgi:dolichol-phosphate mannosyltransferase
MVEVAIVVPTYNERGNVVELVRRLERALGTRTWEVVFVDDDSPDGTAEAVRALAREKPHVRCLQRIARRGLSRAVVEGVLSTSAPTVVVMDADLQHDETVLPAMLARLEQSALDVVVASRYVQGGSVGDWDDDRHRMSRWATRLAKWVVKAPLTDPMSGFFVIRRVAFDSAVRRLSGEGYKLLIDLFASAPRPLRAAELAYSFRPRQAGSSKLDTAVMLEFVLLLLDKSIGRWIPSRFLMFATVGASGLLVHFSVLWLAFKGLGVDFVWAQGAATFTAMTSNYALNNLTTYRDRRHRGLGWLRGLLSFYAVCGIGVAANVGVASALFARQEAWFLAAAAGAVVGTVWNYVASSAVTWRRV